MAKPRFCMLSTFYPPYSFGGDAMVLYRLVNALARRGYEVDVIHCVDSFNVLSSTPSPHRFPQHPNVTVHSLKSQWGLLSPLLSQQTGQPFLKRGKIEAILRSKKFDVIHFHNISLFGPGVLNLGPDQGEALKLYTLHEHWLVCPMHVLWKYNRRLCERPNCLTCSLSFKRPPQLWRYTGLLPRALDSVDAFIAPSRFTREMHHTRGFSRPITHLPHFVAPPADDAADQASPHPRPYFLFVGRLEKIKGVQTLLPVFRRYPHADLLVAGSGTYEGDLQRQAAGMKNVRFLGSVAQEHLRKLYRHAIAVLVPSLCYEVFGITILEAFVQKTPVLVHALGALPEVVEQSAGGIVYSDPDDIVPGMEQLRTDPALRRRLGENGHRAWQTHWSEDAHLALYFRLLEETAKKKWGKVPWIDRGGNSSRSPAIAAGAAVEEGANAL